MPQARSALANPYVFLALAALCWSGNHVVGRAIAGHVPPFGLAFLRLLIPIVFVWFLARPHIVADWPEIKRNPGILIFLGLLSGTFFVAGQYLGLKYTTALNVSVLNSLSPVMIIGVGALIFRDPLRPIQGFGITLSLLGVLVIIARGDPAMLTSLDLNWGDVIIVGNMAAWAIYSVFLRKRPNIHLMSFMLVSFVVGAIGSIPFAAVEQAIGIHFHLDWTTVIGVAFVALFPGLISSILWIRGVEEIGTNRASPFIHLVPIYSAVLASVFLGEHLQMFHVIGFALILAGIWFAAMSPNAATQSQGERA
ncbi:O-acetylserine/cysteine export protein [Variibacter gotjawalensis]|uniref:O-acetylserine/cysteine export protein n=1 Tax=Variibacter gotjawalensis TaxID=1333996 RepID=A0A0S3PZM5_9BRAD|nr:DMT family transporter [Variibacter gotjawalensis]NIK47180.1 drug/metabolite transporter (DMT)-like permease [Variibacter gotjawalensis]RZS49080.1 drug/metabolite transporter (DMT)-like permease [Variibacter gotjawalensis]BAT61342.1 O-acetylserine/cysteine export protein [Variibacter gotjawalensis]